LYEDEKDNYNYEKGAYTLIPFTWEDTNKTLTIADRKGEFPTMIKKHIFNIVVVSEKSGTGLETSLKYTKTIQYAGKKCVVKL
jgi:alpha-D-xyloside xylohydrolase